MHLIEEIKIEKDNLPIQEIGSELKPGMIKAFFPAETRRMVHVNRHAITANVSKGKNYPTCIVIDADGTKYQFHAIVLQGPAALKYEESPEVAANVFLVTNAAIEAYLDPNAQQFFVQEMPVMKELPKLSMVAKFLKFFANLIEPISSCRCLTSKDEENKIHLANFVAREEYAQAYAESVNGLAARNMMLGIANPQFDPLADLRIVGC